jgi:transcriptional regulator with XRE-family HTH domain
MKTTGMTVHEGKNIKRIREILGVKQEALAIDLGLTQQAVSLLEQKETIDSKILDDVAKILKVPVEAIKNFSEEAVVNNISCNFHDSPNSASVIYNFNPIDKMIEVIEENKKLYEKLLQTEREKVALLEKMAEKKVNYKKALNKNASFFNYVSVDSMYSNLCCYLIRIK